MASKNVATKTTSERLASLLNTYYAKKTDVAAVLGTAQDASSATTVYGTRALANSKVASIAAGGGIDVNTSSPNSATAPKVGIKLSAKTGNDLSIETGSGEEGLYFHQAAAAEYSITKQAEAETGYFATYQLTKDNVAVGAKINIPKDFLVKGVALDTVTAADKAEGGKFENDDNFSVGDKYIDFTVNVKAGATETAEHIYLNVKDLVDVYTPGNGIDISNSNAVSIKIDSSNANGLGVTSAGLKLALATPDTYSGGTKTAEGTAGAMSSADKYKLSIALTEDDITDYTEAELRTLLGLPAATE